MAKRRLVIDLTNTSDSEAEDAHPQPPRRRRRVAPRQAAQGVHASLLAHAEEAPPPAALAALELLDNAAAAAAGPLSGDAAAASPAVARVPAAAAQAAKVAPAAVVDTDDDDDVEVVAEVMAAEKGQVATRDLPHPRPDCAVHKFRTVPVGGSAGDVANAAHCSQCYCYVCDVKAAECPFWGTGAHPRHHANAHPCARWDGLRDTACSTRPRVPARPAQLGGPNPLTPQRRPRLPAPSWQPEGPSASHGGQHSPPMLRRRFHSAYARGLPAAAAAAAIVSGTVAAGTAAASTGGGAAANPDAAGAATGVGRATTAVALVSGLPAGAHFRPDCPHFGFLSGNILGSNGAHCHLCVCCRCRCLARHCQSWGSGTSATDHANLRSPGAAASLPAPAAASPAHPPPASRADDFEADADADHSVRGSIRQRQ